LQLNSGWEGAYRLPVKNGFFKPLGAQNIPDWEYFVHA
jgi:hypothetical protein